MHGKRLSVEWIVHVLACVAEGVGRRATALVFEVAPNPVLQGLGEAAVQLQAFRSSCLCDMHVTQLQLDALDAVIRALKTGETSEDNALKRLGGSRPRVWTAIAPVSNVLLAIEEGPGRWRWPSGWGLRLPSVSLNLEAPVVARRLHRLPARHPGPLRCVAPA